MATLPQLQTDHVVTASDWNAHVDQINTNTTDIATATSTNNSQATAINTLESRTTNASTGNTALGARVTNLEAAKLPGTYYGEWTDNNTGGGGLNIINTAGQGQKLTVYTNAVGTPTGMSMNNGTVTVTNAGLYLVNASIQLVTNTSSLIAMWISKGSGSSSTGVKYGPTSGFRSDVLAASGVVRLAAGGTVSVYAAVWQNTPSAEIWRSNGNNLSVTYLGA